MGVLLYFSINKNSYTLNLLGKTELLDFPFVKLNDNMFEIIKAPKIQFGTNPNEILINYMNWELDYIKNEFKREIKSKNIIINHNKMLINFWQYNPPPIKVKEISKYVKTTFFIDFVHNDLIHRFSYPSTSGNELEAKQFLLKLFDGVNFYQNNIDIEKLQKTVKEGKTFYYE